jgi:PAS domain S-box-containing protein
MKFAAWTRSTLAGYAIAAASSAAGAAVTLAFPQLLAPMRLFFLWVAVLVTAVLAGFRPALLAIALCALAAAVLMFPPAGSLTLAHPQDVIRLTLFCTFAAAISAAVGMRRRAEERARSLGQWLTTTLRSIGDAVIATDERGRVTFMNPPAETMTGWPSADAIGRPLSEVFVIVDEETRVPVESPVERVLRDGHVVTLANHTVVVRRDGSEVPIDDSAAPIRDADGRITGTVLVFHDATERKVSERRLRESERRYRTLVEAAPTPQAVWTASADGHIVWRDEWLAITGRTREEVDREGGLHVVHPDDVERTRATWTEAIANAAPYQDEIRVRVANGHYRWFAIRAVPVIGDDGAVTEWIGVVADIHERRRHEHEGAFMNRATDVLGSSLRYEETLRNLAKLCVPELGDWCAVDIARDGEDYERLAVEHKDPAKKQYIYEVDRRYRVAPELDPIVHVLATGQPQLLESVPDELLASVARDAEHLAIARSLAIRSWIIAPMIARGRTLGAITLVVTAESDRAYSKDDLPIIEELARRAAIAIDNARLFSDAEAANRAKDEFLTTLSHELRTPLTSIVGWASMLHMGKIDEETTRLAIETILRSAKSQAELIDDLLDLSRVVSGKLDLQITSVDLVQVAEEVVVAARPAAEAKQIALRFTSSRAVVLVRGDERRLRQVIWNLASNAVKFTDRGGTIDVRVSVRDRVARLDVSDTGRGIEPAFLPHVWERFRQADSSSSRQFGGLGLGLAVARHLVELHGGNVRASSDGLGKGSTFSIELPLPAADPPRHDAPAPEREPHALLAGRRVLVVDDEADSRVVLAAMLRQYGADVTLASSADDAMAMFVATPHDVIVSDIAMPSEDGYSLLRRLREASARLPVIAVSAIGAGTEDRARALAAGFNDFVRKPVEPEQLAGAVARQLTN